MDTDLHLAARAGDEARLAQWMRLNAWYTTRLDSGNQDGHTALMLASMAGSVGCVDQLLAAGVKVDVADPRGNTALSHASTHGHVAIVARLLGSGAKADHVNLNGSPPLILASSVGHVEVVERLLAARVNVNQPQKGTLDTALTFAASKGHAAVVKKLLKVRAKVNHVNKSGNSALILASRKGFANVVQLLIQAGADVNVANQSGATALSLAIEHGREEVMLELLMSRTKPTMTSKQAEEALAMAKSSDASAQAVFTVATAGDIPELLGAIDHHLCTRPKDPLLHCAIKMGRLDMAVLLLQRGASPRDPDASGSTPLHYAVKAENLEAIKLLVDRGADLNAQDNMGETALTLATAAEYVEVVQHLVDAGAEIDDMNYKGQSALTIAVARGSEGVLRVLLAAGAGLAMSNAQIDKAVTTAESKGHRGVVSILGQYQDPAKIMFAAIQRGDLAAVASTADEHKNARTDCDLKRTPLQVATQQARVEIVELLLRRGANIHDVDANGRTALHYAADASNTAIVTMLLASGADVNAQDHEGQTPLLLASKAGDATVVQLLLQHGARADVASRGGETPLSAASSEETQSVLQLYHNREQYQDRCLKLLSAIDSTPTEEELKELVPLITSVYDLRQLLSLISLTYGIEAEAVNATNRNALAKTALQHIIAAKLVFDDNACVFFKLVLDHCKANAWLPTGDIHMLDRQAEKVNTESAEWVVELQRKVQDHTWRLDAHEKGLRRVAEGITHVHKMVEDNRTAIKGAHSLVGQLQSQIGVAKKLLGQLVNHGNQLSDEVERLQERIASTEKNILVIADNLKTGHRSNAARLQQENTSKTAKSMGGLLASVAGFLIAPEWSDFIGGVVDLVDSQQIVDLACNSADMVQLLTEEASDELLKPAVETQLKKLAIPKEGFVTLLREEVALQHPEVVEECVKRGLPVKGMGFSRVTDDVKAMNSELTSNATAVAMLVSELELAIQEAEDKRKAMDEKLRLQHAFRDQKAAAPSMDLAVNNQVAGLGPSARGVSASGAPSMTKTSTVDFGAAQQIVLLGDVNAFPFHTAVQECQGQFDKFKELVDMLAGVSDDASATMEIQFRSVSTSEESMCAAEYAYCLGHRAVGDLLVARVAGGKGTTVPETRSTTQALHVELLEADDEFPYISIVEACGDDVEECEDMCETIEDDGHAIDARIRVKVVRESNVVVRWTAVEYAVHLGYVEIVKLLLKQWSSNVSAKDKIQLLKQAKERAKAVEAQTRTAASA